MNNLTHLTLGHEAFERLPESIGQLSQLKALTTMSDKIKQLSDSLVNLKKLRRICVPNDRKFLAKGFLVENIALLE